LAGRSRAATADAMHVVVQTDAGASDRLVEDAVFAASSLAIDFRRYECASEDDVIACCADAHAVIPAYAPLTRRVLDTLKRCRVAAFMSTGFNSVDLAAATELGILVTHVPDYCTVEVADHTLAMLLALGRNLTRLRASVRAGVWDYEAAGKPGRLADQTLGLIGLGRIGGAVAGRAGAFGLRVIAADPYVDAAAMATLGVGKAGLDDVLGCDYVSLHCALTGETRGIVDAAALARMKPTAFLINTARGACVDTAALTAALQDGAIAGAGLDVTDPEPLPAHHPLRTLPTAIVTPHAAFLSERAEREAREKTCAQVVTALRGRTPPFVVNTEVLRRPDCRLWARGPD
jgi:D-3-phosphoglycerate dehydrogenase